MEHNCKLNLQLWDGGEGEMASVIHSKAYTSCSMKHKVTSPAILSFTLLLLKSVKHMEFILQTSS